MLAATKQTGKRKIQYHTFRGTKREAQIKLAELIAAVDQSKYVEPNKITVAEFVRVRVDHWEAAGDISRQNGRPVSRIRRKSNRAAHRRQGAAKTATARHRGMAYDPAD